MTLGSARMAARLSCGCLSHRRPWPRQDERLARVAEIEDESSLSASMACSNICRLSDAPDASARLDSSRIIYR
jgi:hypothetical protein